MLVVETIAKIRRKHLGEGKSIRSTAREIGISRNTVRKVLRDGKAERRYDRSDKQPRPKLDGFSRCKASANGENNLQDLMNYSRALPVSGYAAESEGLGRDAPALPPELLLFGALEKVNFARNAKDRSQKLRNIGTTNADRFPVFEFAMLIRRCKTS